MSDDAQPTLEYFSETVSPGVPAGTMIAEISLRPPCTPVTAVTVMRSVIAVPELVMKLFAPLITHSPPSRRAVVAVAPASEPPPGSVRPNAPSPAPAASRGSQRVLCSAVPKRAIGMAPSETAASSVIATDESTRASSSSATHSAK